VLIKNVIDPGKLTLACARIGFVLKTVYRVVWQAVTFNDDYTLNLGDNNRVKKKDQKTCKPGQLANMAIETVPVFRRAGRNNAIHELTPTHRN